MDRKLWFTPAFDKTDPDPSKDYGVGDLELRFVLSGEKGAVEFQLATNWYQPHVMERRLQAVKRDVLMDKADFLIRHFIEPMPLDICYFSPVRLSEDDSYFENGIFTFRGGEPCFYGYEYRNDQDEISHDAAYWKLVTEGDEALWKYLEDYYVRVFGVLE